MRLLCVVTLLLTLPTNADQARVHALEKHYQSVRTLKAGFYERYSDGKGPGTAESGTVYFSRPGRMRWDYESPEPKVFLVDGKNVWFYVPADRTASRAKINESSDWRTPLALLTGKADLSHLCRSIEITNARAASVPPDEKPSSNSGTIFNCKARSSSAADSVSPGEILFETDAANRLVRVAIREPGNVETEFRFGNWEENLLIPEATFHFAPPPGVTIVDEATLAGATRQR